MKRHLLWLVEVLIWLLILFSVSDAIIYSKLDSKKALDTYQIFLPDVDGLINGSPVRFMGIQIGYVSQINIVGDDVYLKFIITEPNVKIPDGTIATVEFAGLGGSKSLELYPPSEKKNLSGKLIIAERPKRIHDSLSLLNNMYNQVIEIAFTTSNFMKKLGLINNEKVLDNGDSQKQINNILNSSDNWLDNLQQKSDKISNNIKVKAGKRNGTNVGNNK